MKKHIQRMVSLLLVLILSIGMIPGVSAAETDTPGTPTEDTTPTQAEEAAASPEETQTPAEVSEPETMEPDVSPEADEPEDTPLQENPVLDAPTLMTAEDYDVMALASTQNQKWDHSISVTTTKKDSNPNVPLRIATQMLIYEIVCGLRDPVTFESNSTNECGTKGNIFYEVGAASVPYFAPITTLWWTAFRPQRRFPVSHPLPAAPHQPSP